MQNAQCAALALLLTAAICTCPGCSKHAGAPPPAVAPQSISLGLASFKILTENPSGAGEQDSRRWEIVPPMPIGELSAPAYPDNARQAGSAPAFVYVRVHLDAAGQVAEITDSPIAKSTPGRFARECRTAAETAIRRWRFRPARSQEVEDGKDLNGDGKTDYSVLISSTPIAVYFDVQFEFSLAGTVRSKN